MYKIGKVAEIAKISIKTLRHYDKIGILVPQKDNFTNFRYYTHSDLIKLQQILFYKELGFQLSEIKEIFDNSSFVPLIELKKQRNLLYNKLQRTEKIILNIEKTIFALENNMENILMISDEELYEGFTQDQAEQYKNEATLKWGDKVKESEIRIKKLGSDGWKNLKEQGEAINKRLAELMDKYPEHPDVQEQIMLWHNYIDNFYECTPEIFLELGKMYSQDNRFKEYYDKYRIDLAYFITKSIEYYFNEKKYLKRK